MKKFVILAVIYILFFSTLINGEQKKGSFTFGPVVSVNKLLNADDQMTPIGVGLSIAYIPANHGFSGIVSLSYPLYIMVDEYAKASSGLVNDSVLGYGKTFEIDFSFLSSTFYLSLSGGLHYNLTFLIDQSDTVGFFNAGPGLFVTAGSAASRFRVLLEIHYDFLNTSWGDALSLYFSGPAKHNVGGTLMLGIKL